MSTDLIREVSESLSRVETSIRNTVREILYELHPATVIERAGETISTVIEKVRPPPPHEAAPKLIDEFFPKPKEAVEMIPKVLPSPKQIVDAVKSTVDPAERFYKIVTPIAIGGGIAVAGTAIALAILLSSRR